MTTPKSISTIIISLSLLLTACKFNVTYTDRQIDKEAAEKVTNLFFLALEGKNYEAADTLVSKDFYKITSKQKLNKIFALTEDRLGDIQDTNLGEWYTQVVTGTNPSAEYVFNYEVRFQYYTAQVKITLKKDADDKIRVIGYSVHSDGFDEKDAIK